ncbi:MAG: ZIP family metal transporter, partial [Candidatus Zixiibacteriota bacterium]
MANVWFYTLASVLVVSLISLVGIVALSFRENRVKQALIYLVGFSAGGLLGDAFIHLLPEAAEKMGFGSNISLYVLSGVITYFIIEKFIRWR